MSARVRFRFRWAARLSEGLRELARTPVRFAIRLAVARLITQWRSLLTVIAGTVLAASIGALVPLYTTAIAQVGMTQRLAAQPARDVHFQASINLRASTQWADGAGLPQKAVDATQVVQTIVRNDLGEIPGWVQAVVPVIESEPMGFSVVDESGEPVPMIGARARVAWVGDWAEAVQVVAGRLPVDDPDGADLEVVIGLNVANALNLTVDSLLVLDQGMSERGVTGRGHPSSQPVTARLVGIVAPVDALSPYWMEPSPLRLLDRRSGAGQWDAEFVWLTTENSVLHVVTTFIPDTPTRIGWRVLFAHDNLPFSRLDRAREALHTLERHLAAAFMLETPPDAQPDSRLPSLGYSSSTRLIDFDTLRKDRDNGLLLAYAREVELLDAPFGLLLLQVGALVLFYLMVTAALVRRGERREIAMLQSRGAWDSQIILLRGIEALVICALATALAPLLARLVLTALGPSVANTEEFPLPLTADAFAYAGAAALVTFLALLGTLRPVLRLPLILAGGAAARAEGQHWWQRYYLDAVLAVVGLGALGLLVRRGSPLSDVNLGGEQADPLMLMAPALLFLALGSLALRFFPVMARIAARAAARRRGVIGALAGWQVSREPVHYGRITFLLALAIGIGWFATSFRATVANSHQDQARYRVGTDLRLVERDTALNANRARPAADYESLGAVSAASLAYRAYNANLSTRVDGDLRGTLLAIDPASFGATTYWRSDLGTVAPPRPPDEPLALPERGLPLPVIPARVGLWARFDLSAMAYGGSIFHPDVDALTRRIDLGLRFLDAEGTWLVVPAGLVEVEYARVGTDAPGAGARSYLATGWAYLEADLAALAYSPVGPLNLVSIFWQYRSPASTGQSGMRLTVADLTLIDAAGQVTPFDPFGGRAEQWQFAYDQGATAEGTVSALALDDSRTSGLIACWDQDAQRSRVGLNLNYPDRGPIPAIISRRMQAANSLTVGPNAAPFTLYNIGGVNPQFRAVGTADYFPSLYDRAPGEAVPAGDSFMVVDSRDLLYRLNQRPSAAVYADEAWLRLAPGFDRIDQAAVEALVEQIEGADNGHVVILSQTSLAGELGRLRANPLGLGLLGLMYLAFITALVLSVVGLLTYAGLTAQARRTEFGVLRALGLSALRVVAALALEQAFVMAIGVALGAVLGAVLAGQVVPTLALGATGEDIVPPFVMRVEVRRLIEYALMMGGVMGLVLGSSLLLVRQMSLARTLRLGDE